VLSQVGRSPTCIGADEEAGLHRTDYTTRMTINSYKLNFEGFYGGHRVTGGHTMSLDLLNARGRATARLHELDGLMMTKSSVLMRPVLE